MVVTGDLSCGVNAVRNRGGLLQCVVKSVTFVCKTIQA